MRAYANSALALSTRNARNATFVARCPDWPAHSQQTRVFLRLRMAPVRHRRVAETAGELLDLLTVAGMAAGLRERVTDQASEAR